MQKIVLYVLITDINHQPVNVHQEPSITVPQTVKNVHHIVPLVTHTDVLTVISKEFNPHQNAHANQVSSRKKENATHVVLNAKNV